MVRVGAEQGRRIVDPDVRAYYAGMLGYASHQSDNDIQAGVRATLKGLTQLVNSTDPDPRALEEYQLLTHRLEIVLGKTRETVAERRQRVETTDLRNGIPRPRAAGDRSSTRQTGPTPHNRESFDDMLNRLRNTRRLRRRGVVAAGAVMLTTTVGGLTAAAVTNSPSSPDVAPPAAIGSPFTDITPPPTIITSPSADVPTPSSVPPTTTAPRVLTLVDNCSPITDITVNGVIVRQFDCHYPPSRPGERGQLVRVSIRIYPDGSRKYIAENTIETIPGGGETPPLPVSGGCAIFVAPGDTSAALKC